jgi:hypothetical protein
MAWVDTRDAVVVEIDALLITARWLTDDQWRAPTTCAGWTAGDAAATSPARWTCSSPPTTRA